MTELTYLFDPLCGWCYGAAPALADLRAVHTVSLAPTGMFIAPGRTMEPGFVAHIGPADRRIAAMTGQVFSDAYRTRVLGHPNPPFDSGPATRALTAVWLADPSREAEALTALQRARYVDGRDICDAGVLGDILADLGLPEAAARARAPDAALIAATETRTDAGQMLMARHGLNGVPALLVGMAHPLPNGLLFGPRPALLDAVAAA